ncbi:MAG: DapH/DapD/GlmU-related protein [Bacteroidota bacterium]
MISPEAIAEKFGLKILGNIDVPIEVIGSLKKQSRNALLWIKNEEALAKLETGYAIINSQLGLANPNGAVTYLITKEKPRLIFAKIIQEFFKELLVEDFTNQVEMHQKNPNIIIGENVFIGKNVVIGDGTVIHHNVVIYPLTKIGKNCIIRTHVSLGTEGLGLEMDASTNTYIKFPQLGGVILEDNVEIGPTATIRRSALDDTIIKRGTKIGSLVNIGHNCIIGENCILTCQIVTSGSSIIGDNVFMGVNSIVKNGVNIGSNVTLGQGAVVTKNVPDNSTYVGNPAEPIETYRKWSQLKVYLFKLYSDVFRNDPV